ncbi:Pyridoxal-phosphate dependent enzyme, partial [Dillenia turbinata]
IETCTSLIKLFRPSLSSTNPITLKRFSVSSSLSTSTLQTEERRRENGPVVPQRPDSFGRFGIYGGKYVPETLMHALSELESALKSLSTDNEFRKGLDGILKDYVGRESPLYFAERLTEYYKRPNGEGPLVYLKREELNHTGAYKINNAIAQALLAKRLGKKCIIAETGAGLKREDLNHTGAHKINNAIAQALLANQLGKKRIIAETEAGQHGVATATVCARFGLDCIIYVGAQDMERQVLKDVYLYSMLFAANDNFILVTRTFTYEKAALPCDPETWFQVRAVHSGTATLKYATSEAIRDWVTNVESTHYILGSVAGPHLYPFMVREFHAVIGKEIRKQALEKWGGNQMSW